MNTVTPTFSQLIVTVWNLTSSFTQPLFGWLNDQRGFGGVPVKYTILICAFFISCIGLISNYWLTLLFAACAALGHALFHPSALSLVSRLASGPNRGRLTSFFVVGGNIGFAVGPLIAGVLVTLWGTSRPGGHDHSRYLHGCHPARDHPEGNRCPTGGIRPPLFLLRSLPQIPRLPPRQRTVSKNTMAYRF
ncbi:MFS transporter [Methanogenium cariaci]|uniref:MFS transporter n=1 Tax=Methanogenium cariaci TaxID=2197 RepID=UPI001FDFCD06|nr:MFS transporter [Methanogenium cariaci]